MELYPVGTRVRFKNRPEWWGIVTSHRWTGDDGEMYYCVFWYDDGRETTDRHSDLVLELGGALEDEDVLQVQADRQPSSP